MNVNDNHIGCTIFFPELYYISSFWSRIQGRYFSCVWRFNLLTHYFFFYLRSSCCSTFFFKVFRSSRISTYCRSSVIYSNLFLLDFFFFHFPSPIRSMRLFFHLRYRFIEKNFRSFIHCAFFYTFFFFLYISRGVLTSPFKCCISVCPFQNAKPEELPCETNPTASKIQLFWKLKGETNITSLNVSILFIVFFLLFSFFPLPCTFFCISLPFPPIRHTIFPPQWTA